VQLARRPRSQATVERSPESWEPFTFAGPAVRRVLPAWLHGAERGAASGLVGIVLGPLPFYVLYVWRNWPILPPESWRTLVAQAAAFVLATGVAWGWAVGGVLGYLRGRPSRAGSARRWIAGTVAGAAVTAPAGILAALHFGQQPTPYFGGAEMLLATGATVVCAGVGFARAQRDGIDWRRAAACALGPAPLAVAGLALVGATLPSAAESLEIGNLRALADTVGLAWVGALVGAFLGGLAGGWMGLSSAIAATD
jgi:hypothetical protein